MASTEKFCLKWNDFENNISAAFCDLRDEKDFFDVTLVVGETQVSAHKVILAASSQFFRKVLKANPHQHPLLYLRGVKHKELLSILSFMYRGQVNIAQEELSQFLAVAEDLQVKGLTQSQSHTNVNVNKNVPRPEKIAPAITSGASDNPRHPPPLLYQPGMKEEDDEIVECISVTETTSAAANKQVVPTEALDERDEHLAIRSDYNDQYLPIQDQENPSMDQGGAKKRKMKEFNPKVKKVMSLSEQKLQCLLCYKKFSSKQETTDHIRTRHRITLAGSIDKSMRSVFS